MTAAEYAAILDPEHEIDDWWMYDCPECGASNGHYAACFDKPPHCWTYTGPPDLHTARSEAWRGEEWLIARDCQITIDQQGTSIEGGPLTGYSLIASNTDHAAAIAEAVRRVHHGE